MKTNPLGKYFITLLALIFWAAGAVWADSTTGQSQPYTAKPGGSGSGCTGAYLGYAKMTNSAGTFNITPPAGISSCTFTDASGFAAPYVSVTCVQRRSDFFQWCGTNSVTFPATNTQQYTLTIYVKSSPPPTNGPPIVMQALWH